MLSKRKWVNRCPLLEIANNVTVFFPVHMCLEEWRRLIIILFAYWEVASIIFLGLHDKLQIAKVIYAILNLFCICFCASVCVCVGLYECACMLICVCVHLHVQQNEVNIVLFFLLLPPFWCVIMEMDVRACEPRGLLLHGGSIPLYH